MRTMVDSTKPFYPKALAILVIAALVGAVVGCETPVTRYSLTVTSTAGGEVTAPGEDTFEYSAGTVVELEAVPDEGYRFVNWTGDVATVDDVDAAETRITMDGDYSITGSFCEAGTFPDANLEAAVREAIGKPTGDIYPVDLEGLTELDARESDIADLTGLEHAINLTVLRLDDNEISDISPLEGLTKLTHLNLWRNQVDDISPLRGLTNLIYLNLLMFDQISDISPLEGLTNLSYLILTANQVSDISPLEGLTSLTELHLSSNQLSDISPLDGLTNLTELSLSNNEISDISPLEGLTNLTVLYLRANQISDISSLANLSNLSRMNLTSTQISDISPLEGLTNLTRLYLGENQISDISSLAGLINLTGLYLHENQIRDIEPLVENEGLGEGDAVTLNQNPLSEQSINDYIPELQARGVTVYYDKSG